MPLIKGKSQESFDKNLKTEMHEGKPLKQSLAIAYSMRRQAKRKKMAEGGDTDDSGPTTADLIVRGAKFGPDAGPRPKPSATPAGYAEGGEVVPGHIEDQGIHEDELASGYLAMPEDGVTMNHEAMMEDDKRLNQHGNDEIAPGGDDIVDRIMRKRYSEGGKVANATPITAGFRPNEFDDLVLRDGLESDYGDDDNSGDELGNEREDHDREDIVARIMRSRAKKDRLPRPA